MAVSVSDKETKPRWTDTLRLPNLTSQCHWCPVSEHTVCHPKNYYLRIAISLCGWSPVWACGGYPAEVWGHHYQEGKTNLTLKVMVIHGYTESSLGGQLWDFTELKQTNKKQNQKNPLQFSTTYWKIVERPLYRSNASGLLIHRWVGREEAHQIP